MYNDLWQPKIRSQPLGLVQPGANGPLLWGKTRSGQKKSPVLILKRKEWYVAKSIPSEETFENINVWKHLSHSCTPEQTMPSPLPSDTPVSTESYAGLGQFHPFYQYQSQGRWYPSAELTLDGVFFFFAPKYKFMLKVKNDHIMNEVHLNSCCHCPTPRSPSGLGSGSVLSERLLGTSGS